MIRRTFALACLFVVAAASPVFAHAALQPGSVPGESDQRLTMDVAHERGGAIHNTNVRIYLPTDWRGVGCEAAAPWRCTITPNALEGRTLLEWAKDAGAGPTAADEAFVFTAHTGAPGRRSLPVNQTYSSGETVRWIGAENDEEPAAFVTVTAAAPATTTTSAPGATTSTAAPTPTTSPPGSATTSPTTTAAGVATTTTTAVTAGETTTTEATTTTSTDSETTTTAANDELAAGTDEDNTGDDGGSALPLVLAAVVAFALAAGVAVFVRRRRLTPSPTDPAPPIQ